MSEYKCAFEGCFKTATCMPKYKAPVIVPIGAPEHAPVGVSVGLKICAGHFAQLSKDPRFKNNLKMNQALMVAALHNGTYAPDFSKTYLDAVDLNSNEFKEFLAIQDKIESGMPPEVVKAAKAGQIANDLAPEAPEGPKVA